MRPRYIVTGTGEGRVRLSQPDAARLRALEAGYDDWLDRGDVHVLRRRDP